MSPFIARHRAAFTVISHSPASYVIQCLGTVGTRSQTPDNRYHSFRRFQLYKHGRQLKRVARRTSAL
ncbi:hypothetical protein BC834DRAFT_878964 [Gloeopeniophorella convolvens]|nr:hypothetical protein BC834DRAFT_878964 [Gloeopeniophorella convolvens]